MVPPKSSLNEQLIQEESLCGTKSYLIKIQGIPIARTFSRSTAVVAVRSFEVEEFRQICLRAGVGKVLEFPESTTLLCWLHYFSLRPLPNLRASIARLAKFATQMTEEIESLGGL